MKFFLIVSRETKRATKNTNKNMSNLDLHCLKQQPMQYVKSIEIMLSEKSDKIEIIFHMIE